MVVTTATIPMMIPSVVSAPRTLLATSARTAIRRDSTSIRSDPIRFGLLSAPIVPFGLLRLLLVVDPDHGAVLEVLRDRAVAPGDDLVAVLQAVQDLDQLVALDPGLDLPGDGLPVLDHEDDLDETVLVGLEAGRGVLALLALLHQLVHGPQGDALERDAQRLRVGVGHDVGAGGHTRAQRLGRAGDADLDLELGLLLAGARGRGVGAA